MKIQEARDKNNRIKLPLFNLGFRPFFLGAGLYAVFSVLVWLVVYAADLKLPLEDISSYQWHAHEMIYGYTIAVIAGFLLSATMNWTGIQTVHGVLLLLLSCLWVIARLSLLSGAVFVAGFFDIIFILLLLVAIILPIIKTKKWAHLGIVSKLILLLIGNLFFYLGVFGIVDNGVYWGIYGGLYVCVGLILMMGRRVVPFFIERGVGYQVTLRNSKFIDVTSLILFIVFTVSELAQSSYVFSAYIALLLFVVNALRLLGWHCKGIWRKPLLWILYLSMWGICFGFLLFYAAYFIGFSKYIAIHSFAYIGIGGMTIGMMSRVALGHTGRNVQKPPAGIGPMFIIFLLGAIVRVVFPLIAPDYYFIWVVSSQILWIIAFLSFIYIYFFMLIRERIDGQLG